ncbi:unnamed protein product [Rotaria magnacalcarata]|uniref:Uncharacterized protein n=1 Tax=Rotaria magnacalcarata TaxID=392030 RepID=A0A816SE37_9BILA|nr:unnamed protein product [Rotaria magnacalcarata]
MDKLLVKLLKQNSKKIKTKFDRIFVSIYCYIIDHYPKNTTIYNTIKYCERGANKYEIKYDINHKNIIIEMKNEQEIAVVKAFEGQSRLPENVSFSLDQHVAEERGVLTYQYLEELVNKFDEYFHHISRTTANTIALTKPEKGSTIQNMLIQNAACGAINDGEVTGEKSIDPLKQVNKAAAKTTNMNFDRRRATP